MACIKMCVMCGRYSHTLSGDNITDSNYDRNAITDVSHFIMHFLSKWLDIYECVVCVSVGQVKYIDPKHSHQIGCTSIHRRTSRWIWWNMTHPPRQHILCIYIYKHELLMCVHNHDPHMLLPLYHNWVQNIYIESKNKLTKMWTCCSPACCTTHIHSFIEHQFRVRESIIWYMFAGPITTRNIMLCVVCCVLDFLFPSNGKLGNCVVGLVRTCCGNHSAI